MVRSERYNQYGERIGGVRRRKVRGNVAGRAKEVMGKGLERGAGSDMIGRLVTKQGHTIILCQNCRVDIRVGVIGRYKMDKPNVKNEQTSAPERWGVRSQEITSGRGGQLPSSSANWDSPEDVTLIPFSFARFLQL